jgi:Tol biopolymer transport system component
MKCFISLVFTIGIGFLAIPTSPTARAESLKPVNLVKLNTENDEQDPFQTVDGNTLYYVSNAKGNFNIMMATRSKAGPSWSSGKIVKGLNPDETSDRRSPFLTKDGKFYFASNAVPKNPEIKFVKNYDLYFSRKYSARQTFTQPTAVIALCTEADELHPWVTPSGKEIYFSRKTEKGWQVLVAKGPAQGAITAPKPLDLPIDLHHATLTPNGLAMYLQGPVDKDRWGIFRSTRARLGASWTKPLELTELNHPEAPRGDMSPSLSPDGGALYFVSDRPGGKGGLDIWMIPVAKLNKKKKVMSDE